MTDIARLGIQIDSTAAQTAADRLRQLTSAGARTETQMGSLGSRSRRLSSDLSGVSSSSTKVAAAITSFGRAMQGLALAATARQVIAITDGYTLMEARLGLVTNSSEQLQRVQAQLFKQAQNNRQGLNETTGLYVSLARATKDVGVSEDELLKVTDAVNKSLLISGTTSAEASGALRQLGQAFASGTLRGDEFNSVNEQMPRLMEAIAKGMGKTVGEMRALAAAGELTTGAMIPALISQIGELNREAAKMPQTFDQSLTMVQNATAKMLGNLEKQTGLVARFAGGLDTFAKFIDDTGILGRILGTDEVSKQEDNLKRLQGQLRTTIDDLEKYSKAAGDKPSPGQIQHMEELRAKAVQLAARVNIATQALKDFANAGDPTGGGSNASSTANRIMDQAGIRALDERNQLKAAKEAKEELDKIRKQIRTPKEKENELVQQIEVLGRMAKLSREEIEKMVKAARAAGASGKASTKEQKEAEAAAKRMAALDLKLSNKDFGADIQEIQRALGTVVSDYQNAQDRLETLRQAGLVDEADYYERRKQLLHADSTARETALQLEIDRTNEEKRIAAQRLEAAGGSESERLEAQRRYNAEIIQLNTKIADSEAEIEQIKRKTNITEQNLETTQAAAARNRLRDTEALRHSAEDYLASLKRQHDLELQTLGMGNLARDRVRGLTQINEKYEQQLLDATRERAAAQTQEQKNQLDEQIKIIKEFQAKALDEYDRYWDQLQTKQRDAATGAREAIANYIDQANDIATQTEGMFTNAFSGLEDAMADAATSGKASFSNLLKGMQADMARFFTRQTVSMLLQMFGASGRGSSAFTVAGNQAIADQAFASGGTFMGGLNGMSSGVYTSPRLFRFASGMGLLAEAGPEAVMPLKRGRNGKLGVEAQGGGGGPINNTFHINMPAGNSGMPSPMEMKRILTTVVERTMSNKQRRNPR